MYKKLLIKDPNNCFYIQQIAANYSFMYKFDEAIMFYKEVSKKCPADHIVLFQLGLCYFFKGDKEMALINMDSAIKEIEMSGDKNLASLYKKEKLEWISKEKEAEKFRAQSHNIKIIYFIRFIKNYFRYLVKEV